MAQEHNVPETTDGAALVPIDLLDWRRFQALRRQLGRFFDAAPLQRRSGELDPFERFMGWQGMPRVEFIERDADYEITAERPGLDPNDAEEKIANDALVMYGENKMEREGKSQDADFSERRYGSFKRSFCLPENHDVEKVAAGFERGVLKVVLSKTSVGGAAENKVAIAAK